MDNDLINRLRFEELRQEMTLLFEESCSLTDPEVLKKSQELDELHNKINKDKHKKSRLCDQSAEA